MSGRPGDQTGETVVHAQTDAALPAKTMDTAAQPARLARLAQFKSELKAAKDAAALAAVVAAFCPLPPGTRYATSLVDVIAEVLSESEQAP